jgi:FtsP/CotA-like multicopper oxidase with cupredoxin domain
MNYLPMSFVLLAVATYKLRVSAQLESWTTVTYELGEENVTAEIVEAPDTIECPLKESETCFITLNVSSILTMTLYPYDPLATEYAGGWRHVSGYNARVNPDGSFGFQFENREPRRNYSKFLWPVTADGERVNVLAVNNRMPGPTIITRLNQNLQIKVINSLLSQSISVHWHGLHAEGVPWVDGVAQVTQCPILPYTSYTYEFAPKEVGTHWYHAHHGALRTEGLYGALIVTSDSEFEGTDVNVGDFVDQPESHTLVLMDWQHLTSTDMFYIFNSASGFINPVDPTSNRKYKSTKLDSGSSASPWPFVSGLINKAGWYFEPLDSNSCVPRLNLPLEFFQVERGKSYRFRIVAAMGLFSFRISIQGHKIKLLATDGVPTKSTPEEVDFIIVQPAERYDFILDATATSEEDGYYWIVADTLESPESLLENGMNCFKGHRAYAILKYAGATPITTWPPDIDYDPTADRLCYADDTCVAINCPFQAYASENGTQCISMDQLQLRKPVPIPNDDVSESVFLNFGFEADLGPGSSINGRHFVLPPSPPVTQYADLTEDENNLAYFCEYTQDEDRAGKKCTHVYTTNTKTVEMVFMNLFTPNLPISFTEGHVVHLHGHYFRVVHVGFGNCTAGAFGNCIHEDIHCGDDQVCDSHVTWAGGSRPSKLNYSNSYAPFKDSVYVPSGAYVVVRFAADNPGWWLLHCHVELHQLGGMAMMVSERNDEIPSPPSNIPKCGNFVPQPSSFQLNALEVSLLSTAAVTGGLLLALLSCLLTVCCVCCVCGRGCCGYTLTKTTSKGYSAIPSEGQQRVTMSSLKDDI